MENWDEIRTAFQVARNGTVSGAAEVLGVHHATVIRHIDALEERLGVKLFQRHARGYTATEAGTDLLRVAQTTADQFSQLASRIKGQGEGVTGELTVTSLAAISPILTPVLADFQAENPGLRIRYLTGQRLFRLEYGEAHVAIRAGSAPDQPDNVVQPMKAQRMVLAGSQRYVAAHGMPVDEDDLKNHRFVGPDDLDNRAPFYRWLLARVPPDCLTFRVTQQINIPDAVSAGAGLGFITMQELAARPDLVEVYPNEEIWNANLWIVTHVDLHRTAKVQAFLTFLKAAIKKWEI